MDLLPPVTTLGKLFGEKNFAEKSFLTWVKVLHITQRLRLLIRNQTDSSEYREGSGSCPKSADSRWWSADS